MTDVIAYNRSLTSRYVTTRYSTLQYTYKVCLKTNATGVIIFLVTTQLKINIIPLKVVPLGSNTPTETLFPTPVAVLEVFM
jgi:hypothetical protein